MLRAELLVRRGRYREAEVIARAAIADIDAEDPRVSRLWCLVGRANHLLCDGYRASEAYQGATQTATSEKVAAEAAWGGLVTAIELEVEGLQEQLEAFERVAPSSPDYQIRVGLGRFLTKSLDQSIERGWDDVESARLLTGVASDPMIISNVHNVAIWTAMLRARYRDAISYANEAISYCTAYDLEFAQAYCLCNRAAAFVGVGRYAEARRDLSTLQDHLRTHPDPYLALMTAAAETKVSLIAPAHAWSRKARQPATEPQTWEATGDEPVARVALGYLLAHTAMADIKEGQIQRARERAERATRASRHVAVQTGASLASALADATAGRSGQSKPLSEALILAGKMGCLDFVVTVQRVFPELTSEVREEGALHVLQVALTNSDGGIARAGDDRLTALTKREREVAELLAAGLSNRDIARRLVIEPSTTKVHVRRVMKKLGVDSRLAAALRLRELTEEETAAQSEGAG
jgi:ATP/maltotriose-dependent transcriptional regulator MalT